LPSLDEAAEARLVAVTRLVARLVALVAAPEAAAPMRASSASSPRILRRCLQVRRSMGVDWLRQAGHEHE
jgi:hypothetical protein